MTVVVEENNSVVVTTNDGGVVVTREPDTQVKVVAVGQQGPPGVGASGSSYRHVQAVASEEWVIHHGMGFKPGGVTVMDSAGTRCEGDREYVSTSTLILRFNAAIGGEAFLS